MKFKKISAVLLAGTMLMAAGCGNKPAETESQSEETTTTVAESVSESDTSEIGEDGDIADETDVNPDEHLPIEDDGTEGTTHDEVIIDHALEAWYHSNIPVTSVVFYNSTETTWEGTTIPCYFPGTDISFILHPEADAGSLIFNVAYLEADRASMSQDIDIMSLSEDDYVVRNQTVDANASGDYILDWSDSHVEEWSGMVYVMVTSADGSVDIVARAAIGVPTMVAAERGTTNNSTQTDVNWRTADQNGHYSADTAPARGTR